MDLTRRNVEIVMAYYRRLQASDAVGMAGFLADDLAYWVHSASPYAGYYDRAAFLGVLPGFFEKQAAPLTFDFKAVTAQEDRVCVYAWGKMPLKDGGCYDNIYHYLFRLRGEKIVEVTEVCAPQPKAAEPPIDDR
jgi:ketosteroid isomerase-like protein